MFSPRRSSIAVAASALALVPAAAAHADPLGELNFADTNPLVFKTTTVGHSNTEKVTLKNSSGTDSVNIAGLAITGPDANQFTINQGCSPSLGPGASCDVDLGFAPDHAGTMQAQLVVDNDGLNQGLARDLTGEAVAAQLGLSTSLIDFGTQSVNNGGSSYWVGVQNNGAADVHVNQVDIDGPDASAFWIESSNCPGQTLMPGNGCSFYVRFQPQEGRTYDATVHVRAPDADFTAAITGIGGVSGATMSPSVVEFGDVEIGRHADATVTMTSSGNLPYMPFVTIFNGGDVGSFRIVKDDCSLQLLDPGDTCKLTLRFAPTDPGELGARMAVLGDNEPKIVKARGVGVGPAGTPSGPVDGGTARSTARAQTGDVVTSPTVRVAFLGKVRTTARYGSNWAYLGRVRCDGAPRCRVTVRTQFVVTFGDATRPYLVRGRGHAWTVGANRRLWAPLPRNLQGTPARILVTIETRAGLATGVQYRNLRLVPARG